MAGGGAEARGLAIAQGMNGLSADDAPIGRILEYLVVLHVSADVIAGHPPVHRYLLLSGLFCVSSLHAEGGFEFREGDRVAFLGDAFMEREQYSGWIEMAATTHFADRTVTFRNLGWSGDTPAGASRCGLSLLQAGLEPADEGWRQLQKQPATYRPSVVVTGYGMAASLPGGETTGDFGREFERLLDQAKKPEGGGEVRILVLGAPPRFLRPGETDATPEVQAQRKHLAEINATMRAAAEKRGLSFVSLDALADLKGLSDNGIHLDEDGYKAVAREIERQLGWSKGDWDKGDTATALRRAIIRKNQWFFHRSRPANMAYIFGFRKA